MFLNAGRSYRRFDAATLISTRILPKNNTFGQEPIWPQFSILLTAQQMLQYAITDRATGPKLYPARDSDHGVARDAAAAQGFLHGHSGDLSGSSCAGLVEQAARLAAGGVDFLQLREKDLNAKDLIGLARRIISAARRMPATAQRPMRVLINGRPDIALAAGADGVHLPSGAEQLTVAQVRRIFAGRVSAGRVAAGQAAAPVIVSVACHTVEEAAAASASGADLILFSPVFGKLISGGERLEGTGLERLAEACRAAGETPVLALGGITGANAQACVDAGAEGIAGIRLFQGTS